MHNVWLCLGLLLLIVSCAAQELKEQTADAVQFQGREVVIELPNLPNDAVPLVMVRIPSGEFMMGSPEDEWGREPNEGPQHKVIISHDFYLGKYEVTQAQWLALMDENPSTQIGANLPVNRVSWYDVQEYLERLNNLVEEGLFHLPTEAEREYAARAGTDMTTYFGDRPTIEETMEHAWFRRNSEGEIHPVGQKKPNPWGLYDMYGNVWEWTADWYGPYFHQAQTDPAGPKLGTEKVFRGASWMARHEYLRAADRGKFTPGNRRNTGGFRIAWSNQ